MGTGLKGVSLVQRYMRVATGTTTGSSNAHAILRPPSTLTAPSDVASRQEIHKPLGTVLYMGGAKCQLTISLVSPAMRAVYLHIHTAAYLSVRPRGYSRVDSASPPPPFPIPNTTKSTKVCDVSQTKLPPIPLPSGKHSPPKTSLPF